MNQPYRARWLYYLWLKACYCFNLRSIASYEKLLGNGLNQKTASAIEWTLNQEHKQLAFWRERYGLYQAYLQLGISEASFLYCLDSMTLAHQKGQLWLA